MEITSRMSSGQNAPGERFSPGSPVAEAFADVAALNTVPAASMLAPVPACTRKFRRFTLALFIANLLMW